MITCKAGNNCVLLLFFAAEIVSVMKDIFSIPEETETKLWNKYMSNTYELLGNMEQTVQDAGLYQGQVNKQNKQTNKTNRLDSRLVQLCCVVLCCVVLCCVVCTCMCVCVTFLVYSGSIVLHKEITMNKTVVVKHYVAMYCRHVHY